jgi:hypothetical protein
MNCIFIVSHFLYGFFIPYKIVIIEGGIALWKFEPILIFMFQDFFHDLKRT